MPILLYGSWAPPGAVAGEELAEGAVPHVEHPIGALLVGPPTGVKRHQKTTTRLHRPTLDSLTPEEG